MVNKSKWLMVGATVISFGLIFISAVISVVYQQALTNLLVGEIAAIAVGHSAYRLSSGKQASPAAAGIAVVSGLILAVSPIVINPVDPILTIMLLGGLLIAVAGVVGLLGRVMGGEEGRETGAQRLAKGSGN